MVVAVSAVVADVAAESFAAVLHAEYAIAVAAVDVVSDYAVAALAAVPAIAERVVAAGADCVEPAPFPVGEHVAAGPFEPAFADCGVIVVLFGSASARYAVAVFAAPAFVPADARRCSWQFAAFLRQVH